MGKYRITIDRLDNVADIPMVTVIECESEYTLREDMKEWVRVEIDPDASVEYVPRTMINPDQCPECEHYTCAECGDIHHSEDCFTGKGMS